jgi:hypothetical protein
MSYKYLFTEEESTKLFPGLREMEHNPTRQELLAEGMCLDENGKDMTHNLYGIPSALKGTKRPEITGEKNGFYGKTHTQETKDRISQKMMGHTQRPKTVEEREVISQRQMGGNNSSARKVSIDGVLYETMLNASKSLGVHKDTVWWRCTKGGERFDEWKLV